MSDLTVTVAAVLSVIISVPLAYIAGVKQAAKKFETQLQAWIADALSGAFKENE